MLFRRYGTFTGGIDLPDEKQATQDRAIEPTRPDGPLLVPLAPCGAEPAKLCVEVGQSVEQGRQIATSPGPTGVDVYSPVNGTIRSLSVCQVAAGDQFVPSPAVEIEADDEIFVPERPPQRFEWRVAAAATLRERIASGGLTTSRRPAKPLARWIEHARSRPCRLLVANAMEGQPYVTSTHRMLIELGEEVMSGLTILARAIEAFEIVIVADSRRTGDYSPIVSPASKHGITRLALPHKYPTGAEAILAKVLTRQEMPPGGTTMDLGVAVIDPATCLAVYRWVACETPHTGRVVTVAGPNARKPANLWAPFGMPCNSLAGPHIALVHNGPMVGLPCPPDAVVGPTTDAVLALDTPVPPPPTPCIRCGWCTDHCPARLNVAALNDAFELGMIARAGQLIAPACVECGVCTYICPARLPLSQRVKQLKRNLQREKKRTAHLRPGR